MRVFTLILIICSFSYLSFSQTLQVHEYFKKDSNDIRNGAYVKTCNENILTKGYYHNGKQGGKWTYYNFVGEKVIEGYFIDGLKNGSWVYYRNGIVLSQIGFKQGNFHGEVKSYYLNGNSRIIYHYNNGVLDGSIKYFYENGQIKEERSYKEGKLDSAFIVYDEEYQERIKIIYDNNRPVSIIKSGDVKNYLFYFEGDLINGNGEYKSYIRKYFGPVSSLFPLEVRNYMNGKLSGKYVSYYNENKGAVGNFDEDYMIGKWKFFDKNGKLIEKKEYDKSERNDFRILAKYQHKILEFNFTDECIRPDIMPRFLGRDVSTNVIVGKDGLEKGTSVLENYIYSEIEKLSINLKGTIFVQLSIGLFGEINRVELIRGLSENNDENEQILNIFRKLPPFELGFAYGFPVNVKYTVILRLI